MSPKQALHAGALGGAPSGCTWGLERQAAVRAQGVPRRLCPLALALAAIMNHPNTEALSNRHTFTLTGQGAEAQNESYRRNSRSLRLSSFRGAFPASAVCCSVTKSCPTLCDPVNCSRTGPLSFTISWSLIKLISIESGMPSRHLILCRSLLLLPSIFPRIRVFSKESVLCIRWPKYWSFSISPSNEYPGLISFRMDWLDLLAVQGTLKSLLQYRSSKASIPWCSALPFKG